MLLLILNVEVWRLPFNPTKSGDFAEHLASNTLRRTGATHVLPFSVFASHIKITSYALKQLFRASSCKQTLVGRFHHLIGSYEMMNHFSQHTYAEQGLFYKHRIISTPMTFTHRNRSTLFIYSPNYTPCHLYTHSG